MTTVILKIMLEFYVLGYSGEIYLIDQEVNIQIIIFNYFYFYKISTTHGNAFLRENFRVTPQSPMTIHYVSSEQSLIFYMFYCSPCRLIVPVYTVTM